METPEQENNNYTEIILSEEKTVRLIGTAHVSKESADYVQRVIFEEKPDTVCVELCNTRLD
ncbi:MAG: TraB/GumN family protein, partial [Desulfobacteraceae bacterium]|nr:TraB/GumN family protein [Desulfobacteraceae bacterium]